MIHSFKLFCENVYANEPAPAKPSREVEVAPTPTRTPTRTPMPTRKPIAPDRKPLVEDEPLAYGSDKLELLKNKIGGEITKDGLLINGKYFTFDTEKNVYKLDYLTFSSIEAIDKYLN